MTGASGRAWFAADGRFRVELQSENGDAQVVSDGRTLSIYDATTNTDYRVALPQDQGSQQQPQHSDTPPSVASIEKGLARLGQTWNLSGAIPSDTAGQPTYTVRVTPKGDGGLLGAAKLAFDAANGTPLSAAIYAEGQKSPVLALKATDVSFGPISNSVIDIAPPAGAKVVDLAPAGTLSPMHGATHDHGAAITGVQAVQAKLPFTLSAPDQLAGLPRKQVWLTGAQTHPGAIVTYGQGLGGIAVFQTQAKSGSTSGSGSGSSNGIQGMSNALPSININGATGSELSTALGTVVTFQKGGVEYTVIGSVPAQAAETAARQLG
jgi:outer membrane lipoprotein-sorting protein